MREFQSKRYVNLGFFRMALGALTSWSALQDRTILANAGRPAFPHLPLQYSKTPCFSINHRLLRLKHSVTVTSHLSS